MTTKKVCGVCKSEFWARGNRAKYCSPECRKFVNSLRVSRTLNSKEGKGGTRKILILKKLFLNRLGEGSELISLSR